MSAKLLRHSLLVVILVAGLLAVVGCMPAEREVAEEPSAEEIGMVAEVPADVASFDRKFFSGATDFTAAASVARPLNDDLAVADRKFFNGSTNYELMAARAKALEGIALADRKFFNGSMDYRTTVMRDETLLELQQADRKFFNGSMDYRER